MSLKNLLNRHQSNPLTEAASPVMPEAPEGCFWRVSEDIVAYDPLDRYEYRYKNAFQVQLHKSTPSLFRKNRSVMLETEIVYLEGAQPLAVLEQTVRAAEHILQLREAQAQLDAEVKRVVGDYR